MQPWRFHRTSAYRAVSIWWMLTLMLRTAVKGSNYDLQAPCSPFRFTTDSSNHLPQGRGRSRNLATKPHENLFEFLPPDAWKKIRRRVQPDWCNPMLATLVRKQFSNP